MSACILIKVYIIYVTENLFFVCNTLRYLSFAVVSLKTQIQIHTFTLSVFVPNLYSLFYFFISATFSFMSAFWCILCHCFLSYVVRHCFKPLRISVSPAYLYFMPYFIISVLYHPYKQADFKKTKSWQESMYIQASQHETCHICYLTHLQLIYNVEL